MAGVDAKCQGAVSELLVGTSSLNSLSEVSRSQAKLLLNQEMSSVTFMYHNHKGLYAMPDVLGFCLTLNFRKRRIQHLLFLQHVSYLLMQNIQ